MKRLIIHLIKRGWVPWGWRSGEDFFTEGYEPKNIKLWAYGIFCRASSNMVWREYDTEKLDPKLHDPRDKWEPDPDWNQHPFVIKNPGWIAKTLQEAGWTMWHTTVQTKSREECAEMGVTIKSRRYAVHYWECPQGRLYLPKIKTRGKFIPSY